MSEAFRVNGRLLDVKHPLKEYPRPQLVRESYMNLNGVWRYALTKESGAPSKWDGDILVPFVPECEFSGVKRPVLPDDTLWYFRRFRLEDQFNAGRVLLHFGGVDEACVVYVNGAEAGRHEGGYLPFSFDITPHLMGGNNSLLVAVTDKTDRAPHMRGAQSLRGGRGAHTPMSGIWQTVWLESVPQVYVEDLIITPLYDESAVKVEVRTQGGAAGGEVAIYANKSFVGKERFEAGRPVTLRLPGALSWTPGNPFLYTVKVTAGAAGTAVCDKVEGYFGMRKFEIRRNEKGLDRIYLNNKPLFVFGVVDKGMWPGALYTPPDEKAMVEDIRFAKECGFNMIRKSGKVEPMRWYYHCDRMGMLVWQDLPAGHDPDVRVNWNKLFPSLADDRPGRRFARSGAEGRASFVRDMLALDDALRHSPALMTWVLFSGGVGQFDAAKLALLARKHDPVRFVDHASGRYDRQGGDFVSLHMLPQPAKMKLPQQFGGRVLAVTEAGGFGLDADGSAQQGAAACAGKWVGAPAELLQEIEGLFGRDAAALLPCGLSVFVYMQLSDTENELDGLMTAQRREKADRRQVARTNAALAEAFARS